MGEGCWHAAFAIIGMIAGAAIYAELYPFFNATIFAWKDFGKMGLSNVFGVSPWTVVPVFFRAESFFFSSFSR